MTRRRTMHKPLYPTAGPGRMRKDTTGRAPSHPVPEHATPPKARMAKRQRPPAPPRSRQTTSRKWCQPGPNGLDPEHPLNGPHPTD